MHRTLKGRLAYFIGFIAHLHVDFNGFSLLAAVYQFQLVAPPEHSHLTDVLVKTLKIQKPLCEKI